MTLVQFFRLFGRNLHFMLLVGTLMAALVWYLTRDEVKTYTSSGIFSTGAMSTVGLQGAGRLDYYAASAELDNLMRLATAYETHEEVASRLLAECLSYKEPNDRFIGYRAFTLLHTWIPDSIAETITNAPDIDSACGRVMYYYKRGDNNPVYRLLYSNNALFGVDHLSSIKLETEGKSDMVRATYTTEDPAICKRTIELLIEIVSNKRKDLKYAMSHDVVEYFRRQLAKTTAELRQVEDALTSYMKRKGVINYYEQTRYIAYNREQLYMIEFGELMKRHAADSTIQRLEAEMANRVNLANYNRAISHLRDSLARASAQLATLEWLTPDSLRNNARMEKLRANSIRIKSQMLSTGDSINKVLLTPKGTEIESMLFQWLRNVMLKEEAEANLSVMGIRKADFDRIYKEMAPVGSEIKRYERESYVHEQSYLENLHSLNMAVLQQKNMMMSANLDMISHPFFPSRPNPSSRKFLIVASFLAGFILTLAIVVAMEYFDKTLKTKENTEHTIGLDVVGVLPKYKDISYPTKIVSPTEEASQEAEGEKKKKKPKKQRIDYPFITERAIGLILQNIKIELQKRHVENRIARVVIISMRYKEGKSMIASLLARRLREYNEKVLLFHQEQTEGIESQPTEEEGKKKKKKKEVSITWKIPAHEDTHPYMTPPWFYDIKAVQDLMPGMDLQEPDYDFSFIELPALLSEPYPVELLRTADVILMVCRANRVWRNADNDTLLKIQDVSQHAIKIILNGTHVDALDAVLGYIPKKRTLFRRIIKGFVTMSVRDNKDGLV